MNTTEKIIRQVSALDPASSLDESRFSPFTSHEYATRPAVIKPAPPVTLRASYDIRSAWHDVTRSE